MKIMRFICIPLYLFFLTFNLQAQTTYSFDKLLIYSSCNSNDTLNVKQLSILTNSNDNSYFVELWEKDSVTFSMNFWDYDRLNFFTEIKKSVFLKSESMITNCDGINSWTEDQAKKNYKKRIRRLKMFQLQDTIIDSISYKYYRVRDNKRWMKRKDYSYRYYVLDDFLSSLSPIFITPSDYSLWKHANLLNKGVIREFGIFDDKENVFYKRKLDSIIEIDKKVVVPDECLQK